MAARGVRASVTWAASSLVGTSTSARGSFSPPSPRRVRSGSPKASVLPEPVSARPQTSLPSRASGIALRWIGVGTEIPSEDSTSAIPEGTPSSENVMTPPSTGGFISAVSATVASEAATATATTATTAARTCLVDGQTAAFDVLAVELFNGPTAVFVGHLDKSEPP
jgi:hypothetical protein